MGAHWPPAGRWYHCEAFAGVDEDDDVVEEGLEIGGWEVDVDCCGDGGAFDPWVAAVAEGDGEVVVAGGQFIGHLDEDGAVDAWRRQVGPVDVGEAAVGVVDLVLVGGACGEVVGDGA